MDIQQIKENIDYNPLTGDFTWRVSRRGVKAGKLAGSKTTNGYITIRVNNSSYLAHRIAFVLMTGEWPKSQVDHRNRIRSDNRWDNLREATPERNNWNRTTTRSLPIGIYERVRKGRPGLWYETKIQSKGKQYSSYFRSLDKAIAWRKEREQNLFQWG